MTNLRVSVALCTFNGAAFLPVQWQSLLDQTRQPDEIVVCDDDSTDQTPTLLRQLSASAPMQVAVVQNPERLGFNANFAQALSRCTGDLIFICDQDDCWLPKKIETMVAFMMAHPDIDMAFCNAELADEHLHRTGQLFWDQVQFGTAAKNRFQAGQALDVLLFGNRVMGCATVLRRSLLDQLLPIPPVVPGYIYDGWFGLIAAARNRIGLVDEVLQLYRTHAGQQVGATAPDNPNPPVGLRNRFGRDRNEKLAPFQQKVKYLQALRDLLTDRLGSAAPGLPQLDRRLAHFARRGSLPTNRLARLIPVLQTWLSGDYARYADEAADWRAPYLAALGDLLE